MSVRHALLALLSEGPKYGLQLRQEFEAKTGEVWPLNVGQVYTTLQRLERDGLVESDDTAEVEGRRRPSAHGRRRRGVAGLAPHPARRQRAARDELVIKVLVALTLPGVDVHEVMQVHRRHLMQLMQRYTRLKQDAPVDDVGLALVADAEIFRLEAVIRWLDAADVRLKRFPVSRPVVGDTAATRARARRTTGSRR